MARTKPIPQPSGHILSQRPRLAPDANRSNNRVDELDLQQDWQFQAQDCRGQFEHANRIDAGLIDVAR